MKRFVSLLAVLCVLRPMAWAQSDDLDKNPPASPGSVLTAFHSIKFNSEGVMLLEPKESVRLYTSGATTPNEALALSFWMNPAIDLASTVNAELRLPLKYRMGGAATASATLNAALEIPMIVMSQNAYKELPKPIVHSREALKGGWEVIGKLDVTEGMARISVPGSVLRNWMNTNGRIDVILIIPNEETIGGLFEIEVEHRHWDPPQLAWVREGMLGAGCHPKARAYVTPNISHLKDVFTVVARYLTPRGRCNIRLRHHETLPNGQVVLSSIVYTIGPVMADDQGSLLHQFSFNNPAFRQRFTVRDLASPEDPWSVVAPDDVTFLPGEYQVQVRDLTRGCILETMLQGLGDPTLEVTPEVGLYPQGDIQYPLQLTGRNFRPLSQVEVYIKDTRGRRQRIVEAETNFEGTFRVLDLFRDGFVHFPIRGRVEIEAVDAEPGQAGFGEVVNHRVGQGVVVADEFEGRHRATTHFSIVNPTVRVSIDGGVGRDQRGNQLSEVRVYGMGFPPSARHMIGIAPFGAQIGTNQSPSWRASVRVDAEGRFDHAMTTAQWTQQRRIPGVYEVSYEYDPALGDNYQWFQDPSELGKFELAECAGAVLPDVLITQLEVTQGIQDFDHTCPIISSKPTLVRAYTRATGLPMSNIVCFLRAFTPDGTLLMAHDGLDWRPHLRSDQRLNVGLEGSVRRDLETTFNFQLPYEWVHRVGEVTFEAQIYSPACEENAENNIFRRTVFMRPTRGLNVTKIRLHTHSRPLPLHDIDDDLLLYDRYWDLWQGLKILPLSSSDYRIFYASDLLYPLGHFRIPLAGHFGDEYDNDIEDCELPPITARLNWYDMWTADPRGQLPGPHYWYGLFPVLGGCTKGNAMGPATQEDDFTGLLEGVAVGPYNRGNSRYFPVRGAETFAHEIMHLIGLRHIGCGGAPDADRNWPYPGTSQIGDDSESGAWGIAGLSFGNANYEVVPPTSATPIMGYCNERWISDYEYKRVHRRLNPFIEDWIAQGGQGGKAGYLRYHQNRIAGGPNVASVRRRNGSIAADTGSTEISRTYLKYAGFYNSQTMEVSDTQIWQSDTPFRTRNLENLMLPIEGDSAKALLSLRAYDSEGTLISEQIATAYSLEDGHAESHGHSPHEFILRQEIELDRPATRLEWVDIASGKVVLERKASSSPPYVMTVTPWSPIVESMFEVSLMANDPDGDSIQVDFLYSPDGATAWVPVMPVRVSVDDGMTRYLFDSLDWAYSLEGKLRAVFTDGFHGGIHEIPLDIMGWNHPPVISLRSPTSNLLGKQAMLPGRDRFSTDNLPVFEADVMDTEDGVLEGESIRWISSINGFLGSGRMLQPLLAPGFHEIRLQARDLHGAVSQVRFNLLVADRELADSDGDGIPDASDPFPNHPGWMLDEDGDGIADEWELFFFGNLTTANATSDFSGNGVTDLEEFIRGSSPVLSQIGIDPDPVPLPELKAGWQLLSGSALDGVGTIKQVIESIGCDSILRFDHLQKLWVPVYMLEDAKLFQFTNERFDQSVGYWIHLPEDDTP